jgi:hypothetical protein
MNCVVPCGVEHRTVADEEAEVILLEPAGVLNTGNVIHEKFTAPHMREDLRTPVLTDSSR